MSDLIWMRSLRSHTYWNTWREPDTYYVVDSDLDADTIANLGFGVREQPPAAAKRTPPQTGPDTLVVPTPVQPDVNPVVQHTALPHVMTTDSAQPLVHGEAEPILDVPGRRQRKRGS
jgi:hypothetical protein